MLAGYYHDFFAKSTKFKASNFRVFDRSGLLSNTLKSEFSADGYSVSNSDVIVYLYALNDYEELISFYQNLPISFNEIFVFCFQNGSNITFKLKLSDNLREKSRFLSVAEMKSHTKNIGIDSLLNKQLSPKYLMSLFTEANIPLINDAFLANPKAKCPIFKEFGKGKVAEIVKSKDKLNITVGVFFDGTKNNRYCSELVNHKLLNIFENNAEVKKVEPENQFSKAKTIFIEQNPILNGQKTDELLDLKHGCSYFDPYTNIVLLHDLYQNISFSKENPQNEIIIKQYVQGVGTQVDLDDQGKPIKYYSDENLDSGLGIGDNGVEGKLENACKLISKQLKKIVEETGTEIGSLTFDLFGFSRGAATARLMSNDLFKKGEEERETETETKRAMPKGGNLGYYFNENKITFPEIINVRFLGIFDTVLEVQFGVTTESISLENFKGRCLHIIALDEYRVNFPLSPTIPSKTLSGEVFNAYLYGAHADIGGGYNSLFNGTKLKLESALDKNRIQTFKETHNFYKNRFSIEFKNNYKLDYLENQFSITEEKEKPINSKYAKIYSLKNNRLVSNKISLVSLYTMLNYCINEKMPFKIEYDKNGNIVFDKSIDKYLELPVNEDFKKYLEEARKFVSEKRSGKLQFDKKVFFNLYREFVHISANYDIHFKNILYVDKPTEDKKRVGMEDKYCEL